MDKAFITDSWNKYLELFDKKDKDVYFTEEYVKLYQAPGIKAECFVCLNGDNVLIFPYLKRGIPGGKLYDFESQYGYGGPLANRKDPAFINKSLELFCGLAREEKIIAGLIRFHPLLKNYEYGAKFLHPVFNRNTVAIDLEPSIEEIWSVQIHQKHRNVIRKAESYGLIFKVDAELGHMNYFREMYSRRMDDVLAEKFYYFSDDYFLSIKKNIKNSSFLGLIYLRDKIIAAAIFLYSEAYGHYHLSWSLKDYRKYYPNNYLIYQACLYLKTMGVEKLHLGGGVTKDLEDSLYKFKKRFSMAEHSFYIGKLILDHEVYGQVCEDWKKQHPENRVEYKDVLLKYRF